jgi:ubiquinone/menaquinone biosynthesis C-methylase UbiE
VTAFAERADRYDEGWLGRWHHDVATRSAAIAATAQPAAGRVLDVGCGTGYLLGELATRLPDATELIGVDAAPPMVATARPRTTDPRVRYSVALAESLPFRDNSFDLVVSTVSFDHWSDQPAGLAECRRVLRVGAHLVLTDLISSWLWPTTLTTRRRARTVGRARALLDAAHLHPTHWQPIPPFLRAVTAQAVE